MKKIEFTLLGLLFVGLSLLFLAGCEGGLGESYSINPIDKLSFSTDTLSFDTVFTDIGSATKEFMIYNTNNDPLEIESIMLANPEVSGFSINVDGRKGNRFQQVEILSHDSLYLFVEVNIDPTKVNTPLIVRDSILFYLNGNRQVIQLEAVGKNVKLIDHGLHITKDSILTSERPFLVYDSLVIDPNVTLTIKEGAVFYMHKNAFIKVKGAIVAEGTPSRPVIFRGDRLDFILDDVLPYDRTPGQWGGITFESSSVGNVLNNVRVRNAQYGLRLYSKEIENKKMTLYNTRITNMSQTAFWAQQAWVEATNCEFSNAADGVVVLAGGTYQFTHCTLVDYLSLETRFLPGVQLNPYTNEGANEKLSVTFRNCIIDGSFSATSAQSPGEIQFYTADNTLMNYQFNHCVLKIGEQTSDSFMDCSFGESPLYKLLGGDKNKYAYDYRLDSITAGVDQVDPLIIKAYPLDFNAINRFESLVPTVGAYQYVPTKK